jgi:glycosyltransferase involved in cell wall biosynthesis
LTQFPSLPPAGHDRALVVSTVCPGSQPAHSLGREAYSYHYVVRAFAPLLERWGLAAQVDRAESRLDFGLYQARRKGFDPIHLAVAPLHLAYLTSQAPNVAFPFWEFPDIPSEDAPDNPRLNWARIASQLDMILTASRFTRDAFQRAGVKTPVHVVPVPVAEEYFSTPDWSPGQRVVLACPCYLLPSRGPATPTPPPTWMAARRQQLVKVGGSIYRGSLKTRLLGRAAKYVSYAAKAVRAARYAYDEDHRIDYPVHSRLGLSGVVYTSVLNPFDARKNWQDLLSAFLLALRDEDDATLVLKLAVNPELEAAAVNLVLNQHRALAIRHRCQVALVAAFLCEKEMRELARGSTYYVNTARAEGACLPLQDYLAAGRPGVAPVHSALADYFNANQGFVVASHPEPAVWPNDPDARRILTWQRHYFGLRSLYLPVESYEGCGTTLWHRLVWQSLHDQLRESYFVARAHADRYRYLAAQGRDRMAAHAGTEAVWPRLAAALGSVPRQDAAHQWRARRAS